jgi:DNA modification methylase
MPKNFTLPTEIVPIKDLKPHPRNYRKHPKEQLKHIVQSIKENKIYRNIVIAKDNTILAGHGVIEGLQILEATEAPCIRLDIDFDSPEALKVLAGDNEIANLANDNSFLLAELLKEVSEKTDNLIGTGYTDSTLEDLLDSLTKSSEGTEYQEPEYQGEGGYYGEGGNNTENQETKEAVEDDFELPEENEIKTDIVLGDLFEIGNHRLLCGDSTDKDSVGRLMNGEKADMVFTDPPYGVSYQSNMRTKSDKFEVLINDDVFITKWIDDLPLFSRGFVFVWTSWKVLKEWIEFCKPIGELSNLIIWDKGGGGMGDLAKTFLTDFEIALTYHRNNELIGKRLGSVWQVNKDSSSAYLHPTQKPVGLAGIAIQSVLETNKICLDLFLGSGSTMVASHQLDRRCYGMELDPRYCQVIIERMVKLDPTLTIKKNGKPFALGI